MKLHLIYGEAYVGKTTTCHKLLKLLLTFGAILKIYEAFGDSDFQATLTIGSKTIGIYSAGDEKAHLRCALEFGRNNSCDILIGTVSYYKHYSELLQTFEEGKDLWWHTLNMGNTDSEKTKKSNDILINLLNAIFERT